MSTIEVASSVGPIRIRVSASETVRAKVLSAPLRVRAIGTPGPEGPRGFTGDRGEQGPPGNLDAGIIVDGGNF